MKRLFLNKRSRLALLSVVLVLAIAVGGTLAYLQDISGEKVNSFEKSNISVALDETTGDSYKIIPGNSVAKDPKVTVYSPDVDCWCFVEVTDETEGLVTWAPANGWTKMDNADVWYRSVDRSDEDQEFYFLDGNQVSFAADLKVADMGDLSVDALLTLKAYVIQKDDVLNTPETAFNAIEEP